MGLSFGHLIVILLLVMVLFGFGKLPKAMGDIGKGIRNLREELGKDSEKDRVLPPKDGDNN